MIGSFWKEIYNWVIELVIYSYWVLYYPFKEIIIDLFFKGSSYSIKWTPRC